MHGKQNIKNKKKLLGVFSAVSRNSVITFLF